jgi:hypothetical protein
VRSQRTGERRIVYFEPIDAAIDKNSLSEYKQAAAGKQIAHARIPTRNRPDQPVDLAPVSVTGFLGKGIEL